MTFEETMNQLKALGTAQNVKIYSRRGGGGEIFGVSFANLAKLKKTIKVDHELAVKLWNSGNFDARSLATMIADPSKFTPSLANSWVKGVDNHVAGDLLGMMVPGTPAADTALQKWTKSKKEFERQTGYVALAASLTKGVQLPTAMLAEKLATIEAEIHSSPNRARHAMIMALIAIGIYCTELTDAAMAAARRIGKIDVDHGDTSCRTPDPIPYIQKALARKRSK